MWHQTDAMLAVEGEIEATQTTLAASTTTTTILEVAEVAVQAVRTGEQHQYPQPTIPEWTGTIPEHYGPGSGCNQTQATIIANIMWTAGASNESVERMLGIISRESLCDPAAFNGNVQTGDRSHGICQINSLAGWFTGALSHYNPEDFAGNFTLNAQACTELWELCGFGPWNYGDYYCRTPKELQ